MSTAEEIDHAARQISWQILTPGALTPSAPDPLLAIDPAQRHVALKMGIGAALSESNYLGNLS